MPDRFSSIFETHKVAALHVARVAQERGETLTDDEALAKSARLESIHDWPEVRKRVEEALRPRAVAPPEPEPVAAAEAAPEAPPAAEPAADATEQAPEANGEPNA